MIVCRFHLCAGHVAGDDGVPFVRIGELADISAAKDGAGAILEHRKLLVDVDLAK